MCSQSKKKKTVTSQVKNEGSGVAKSINKRTVNNHHSGTSEDIVRGLIQTLRDEIKYLKIMLQEKDERLVYAQTMITVKEKEILKCNENISKQHEDIIKMLVMIRDLMQAHDSKVKLLHNNVQNILYTVNKN